MSHFLPSAIPKQNFKISILNVQDYYGMFTHATLRLIQKLIIMACVGSCRSVHATKKQTPIIPIGFCTHFIGICNGLHLGVGQCERTILGLPTFLGMTCIFWAFQFLSHLSLLCMYQCAQVLSALSSMKLKIMHKTFGQSCSIQTLYCVK